MLVVVVFVTYLRSPAGKNYLSCPLAPKLKSKSHQVDVSSWGSFLLVSACKVAKPNMEQDCFTGRVGVGGGGGKAVNDPGLTKTLRASCRFY